MSRQLYADSFVPGEGKDGIPYPDETRVVRTLGQHMTECFAGEITGAGGAGGELELPFEPGYVKVINNENVTEMVRELFVGSGAQVDATGATATGVSVDGTTVTVATAVAPDGETVQVLAFGFRNVNGCL